MQFLLRYRLIVALFLFCGLFLIASIANTVKKRLDDTTGIRDSKMMGTFDSVPEKVHKKTETSAECRKDTLQINGKSWRADNQIHTTY